MTCNKLKIKIIVKVKYLATIQNNIMPLNFHFIFFVLSDRFLEITQYYYQPVMTKNCTMSLSLSLRSSLFFIVLLELDFSTETCPKVKPVHVEKKWVSMAAAVRKLCTINIV